MIRQQTCPICEKLLPLEAGSEFKYFPFCSERCQQVDFFRWSDGKYAIVEPLSPDELELAELDELPPELDDESTQW